MKKKSGHRREAAFAKHIGGEVVGQASKTKADVKDQKNRTYTVKSGDWWQIMLYRKRRILEDKGFATVKSVQNRLIDCLDVFPESRETYKQDKLLYKNRLSPCMRALRDALREGDNVKQFFNIAMFDCNVHFLTIVAKNDSGDTGPFHVFSKGDVLNILGDFEAVNSIQKGRDSVAEQKVLFRYKEPERMIVEKIGPQIKFKDGFSINICELELRNDSDTHYREMKLRMSNKIHYILAANLQRQNKSEKLFLYGTAIKSLEDL